MSNPKFLTGGDSHRALRLFYWRPDCEWDKHFTAAAPAAILCPAIVVVINDIKRLHAYCDWRGSRTTKGDVPGRYRVPYLAQLVCEIAAICRSLGKRTRPPV